MENEENQKIQELAEEGNNDKINIDNERISKYKGLFDKHKNEDGYIDQAGVNDILNEFGKKTTIEDTNELIKKATTDSTSTNIDFDNFVKLMESNDIESLIKNKKENQTNKLTDCQIYLFMLLLLITGSINTIANKLQQNTESLGVKYKGHQKFITFCMFNGELI